MIYITGDTHNTVDMSNLAAKNMKLCCKEQNADYKDITIAIVLGDFGLPWNECPLDSEGIHPTDKTDRYLLDWYKQKPFRILAVQGNHDNYDMIEKLPEAEMFGSIVLQVSDNIFYLKRGEIYLVEGKSFLALGGAVSDDKAYRIPHESWWPQEEWTEKDKHSCISNVKGRRVDYVLSHTGPSVGIACTDSYYSNEKNLKELLKDSNVVFNDRLESIIEYDKWFFGHWHSDWGYEHYAESKYVPLYRQGIII
ncbi:metallophosphoesterase [Treponema parvum]|uniref:Metallophosphoesterase n=1 Tax=Treponema parvum TaxID=138851 RepID=A0A975F198_9SPIR|nr:metallophosphoesterase [Treponema parvum]QTQ12785.1 metallophosphoesterase [Treponema parvum]QTQ15236.1 metallophosphoesterase [Treponema parvum]